MSSSDIFYLPVAEPDFPVAIFAAAAVGTVLVGAATHAAMRRFGANDNHRFAATCLAVALTGSGGYYLTYAANLTTTDQATAAITTYIDDNDLDATLPEGVDCDLDDWWCLQAATIEDRTLIGYAEIAGDLYLELERTGNSP